MLFILNISVILLVMPRSAYNIIKVENLVKKFGNFTAIKGITFAVKEGEIFGILGPNGAGKTTTLETIETLQKQSSGKITIDGLDTMDRQELVKRIIGVQLQSAGFYPELNLVDLLNLFAALYGVDIDPMEMLEKVDLVDKAKSYPVKLSGGQRQRFSIALTLVNTPKVVFLDEPTTGLDPQARINLWDMISRINKQGVTVVLTTHYMEEAEKLCDRVAIMDAGKIVALDSPTELIKQLLASGFKKKAEVHQADLEDVFIHLTGRHLREN